MMSKDWTEEKVAAFIDGSLENAEDIEAVQRALENDSDAQAYAVQIESANAILRQAFEVPSKGETPAGIQAALFGEPGKVEVLGRKRRGRPWIPTAIAAGLALAVGLGIGDTFFDQNVRPIAALGDAPLGGPLHTALEQLLSGESVAEGVQPMLTFWDGSGRACREFEVSQELPNELEFGIACRDANGRWHVEIIVAAPAAAQDGKEYSTASGAAGSALETMLDALGAGPVLSPDDEATLIREMWPRSRD